MAGLFNARKDENAGNATRRVAKWWQRRQTVDAFTPTKAYFIRQNGVLPLPNTPRLSSLNSNYLGVA